MEKIISQRRMSREATDFFVMSVRRRRYRFALPDAGRAVRAGLEILAAKLSLASHFAATIF
jgi:hypothetical protein